jgi:hypothetical protein
MRGSRNTTSTDKQSTWSNWSNWGIQEHADPMSPSIVKVLDLDFLSSLISDGKSYKIVIIIET